MKLFLLLTICLFVEVCQAQRDIQMEKTVGFYCNFPPTSSKPVEKILNYYKKGYLSLIKNLLSSNNSAENLVAIIVLERLSDSGKIVLNQQVKESINALKKSDKLFLVCNGCGYEDEITFKTFFDKSYQHQMQ